MSRLESKARKILAFTFCRVGYVESRNPLKIHRLERFFGLTLVISDFGGTSGDLGINARTRFQGYRQT